MLTIIELLRVLLSFRNKDDNSGFLEFHTHFHPPWTLLILWTELCRNEPPPQSFDTSVCILSWLVLTWRFLLLNPLMFRRQFFEKGIQAWLSVSAQEFQFLSLWKVWELTLWYQGEEFINTILILVLKPLRNHNQGTFIFFIRGLHSRHMNNGTPP